MPLETRYSTAKLPSRKFHVFLDPSTNAACISSTGICLGAGISSSPAVVIPPTTACLRRDPRSLRRLLPVDPVPASTGRIHNPCPHLNPIPDALARRSLGPSIMRLLARLSSLSQGLDRQCWAMPPVTSSLPCPSRSPLFFFSTYTGQASRSLCLPSFCFTIVVLYSCVYSFLGMLLPVLRNIFDLSPSYPQTDFSPLSRDTYTSAGLLDPATRQLRSMTFRRPSSWAI